MCHYPQEDNNSVDPAVIAGERFCDAIDAGEKAFWQAISAVYPEIRTGDLHPFDVNDFRAAIGNVLNAWLRQNRDDVGRTRIGNTPEEEDVCIAGNPALNGRCGEPDCVCAL